MTRVAIAGFGAIGRELAAHLARGIPAVELARSPRVTGRRWSRSCRHSASTSRSSRSTRSSHTPTSCWTAALLPAIAEPFLRAGKEAIVLSAGALLEHPYLVDLAAECGGTITVPTGALVGLDAVSACAEREIRSVRLTTRKPVAGLIGAPALDRDGFRIDAGLAGPLAAT